MRSQAATAAATKTWIVHIIDETFLGLTGFARRDLPAMCQDLRATVARCTGIPTCVGIGPTKTLAKPANAAAKKGPAFGVCDLSAEDARTAVLRAFPVEDVWGIGPATAAKPAALGVTLVHGSGPSPSRGRMGTGDALSPARGACHAVHGQCRPPAPYPATPR